ncbi:MAG: DUF4402 domain-containing protein [Bacteroidota bacterium]
MKKLLILFAAIVMMVGFTTTVMAQVTDTKANDAKAQVLGAISLTTVNPLQFGGFTTTGIGTVIMPSTGARSKTLLVTLVNTTVTPTAASYTVTGTGLATYAITIPIASFNVTNTTGAGAETMAVTAMECSYPTLHSAFSSGGTDAFTVGGTLTTVATQVPGIYTGTFDVTVAY